MQQVVAKSETARSTEEELNRRPELVRLIEARLLCYQALEHALHEARAAYIQSNLETLLHLVSVQASCCEEISRLERRIQQSPGQTDQLDASTTERLRGLLGATVAVQAVVRQLNCVQGKIVSKAAQNNAVLRNLYARAWVYGDPRALDRRRPLRGGSYA